MNIFEELMKIISQGKALVTCMGMKEGRGRVSKINYIKIEVVKAVGNIKCGKAMDINDMTAEMLKYDGETINDWMHVVCNLS